MLTFWHLDLDKVIDVRPQRHVGLTPVARLLSRRTEVTSGSAAVSLLAQVPVLLPKTSTWAWLTKEA